VVLGVFIDEVGNISVVALIEDLNLLSLNDLVTLSKIVFLVVIGSVVLLPNMKKLPPKPSIGFTTFSNVNLLLFLERSVFCLMRYQYFFHPFVFVQMV
jgi:hypothetical protein